MRGGAKLFWAWPFAVIDCILKKITDADEEWGQSAHVGVDNWNSAEDIK